MKFVVQCISGLQAVVASQLEKDLAGISVELVEDGFVAFHASAPESEVREIRYVNNAFAVIDEPVDADTDTIVLTLSRRNHWFGAARATVNRENRRFRVFVSDSGQLVGGGRAMTALVDAIVRATKLTPARATDTEFWIIRRRSGRAFFCKRLTRRIGTERTLRRGELRPQLALLMCLLSEPADDDIVLDPFAGSGALPFARMTMPYNMIFAFDIEKENVSLIRQKLKEGRVRERKGSPLIAAVADARSLDRLDDGFVGKVITDPPWGVFDGTLTDLEGFYRRVLAELIRVLRGDGLVVMLIADKPLAQALSAENAASLELVASHDILVNGRKASIMKWRRRRPAPAASLLRSGGPTRVRTGG